MSDIEALTFDTGGTILDWHAGISAKLAEIGRARGVEADWASITNAYRARSLREMTAGDDAFRPDFNIDDVHRRQIEAVAREHGLSAFEDVDFDAVRDAWHALRCWPDVPGGLARLRGRFTAASLSILSTRLIIDACKPAGIVWDAVISCEMIGAYKPRPEAYLRAAEWLQVSPSKCLMVAAHEFDLAAAARAGFMTALVRRPDEWGIGRERPAEATDFQRNYRAESFDDLADQLGCPAAQ
jgi:2-haloacid dehalogenase